MKTLERIATGVGAFAFAYAGFEAYSDHRPFGIVLCAIGFAWGAYLTIKPSK